MQDTSVDFETSAGEAVQAILDKSVQDIVDEPNQVSSVDLIRESVDEIVPVPEEVSFSQFIVLM